MDALLQTLLSYQLAFFSLAIMGVTLVTRRFIEFFLDKPVIPATKYSKFWTELFLPIMPTVLGGLTGGLVSGYPYPDGISSLSARIAFGLVAGLFSGLVYRVMKSMLEKQLPPEVAAKIEEQAAKVASDFSKDDQKMLDSVKDSIQK